MYQWSARRGVSRYDLEGIVGGYLGMAGVKSALNGTLGMAGVKICFKHAPMSPLVQ